MTLEGAPQDGYPHVFAGRFDWPRAAGVASTRVDEEALDLTCDGLGVEVPDRHDHQVVRRVPAFEETPHLGPVEAGDVRCRPEDRRAVGVGPIALPEREVA